MDPISYSGVSLDDQEIKAITKVLKSGWLAAGPETKKFEEEFARYVGVRYAIFTNSCTSALKMAFKWYLEHGCDAYKLITGHNTYCATYAAAEEMGLVESAGFDDEGTVKVVVHYGGVKDPRECDIEDSAHRIEPNDPLTGKIRCYSFYATKNMTTGSGGMFVTNDKDIYEQARLYWRDGLSTSTLDRATGGYNYEVLAMAGGYDGNDLAASLGRVQLKKLPALTQRRNEIVSRYNAAFGRDWTGNHLYPYSTDKELVTYLAAKGIRVGFFYPPKGYVCLPLHPNLTDEEVDYVIKCVREYEQI